MSKRDDIIAAAIRLAERSEPGQTSLSVRAIAREAGVGASTLRHYFPTQSELHEAVAQRSMDTVVDDFSITDSAIDPAERLFECCTQFLPIHERREIQLELWFSLHLQALGPEPHAVSRRLLEHGHRVTYDALHRWLSTLAAEGHLDPAEVAPAATALFTTIDGIALHSIITPETMTVDAGHEQVRWTIGRILTP